MNLPSTWFEFCGREIARRGKDGVNLIELQAPVIERASVTHQCCESEFAVLEDLGNQTTTFTITVHREFKNHAQKRRWLLRHLASACRGTGELKIIEDAEVFIMRNAVMSLSTEGDIGVAIVTKYTVTGGQLEQLFTTTKI